MDLIMNALKCAVCRKILSQPITLPCGHSICKTHSTESADGQVTCAKCGSRHDNCDRLEVSQALFDLIASQLALLDFGPEHNESVKSFGEFKQQLDRSDVLLNDMGHFIHESVGGLKNKVILKSEELKLKIENIALDIIDDLELYEKQCMKRHMTQKPPSELALVIDEVKKRNAEAKSRLNELSHDLNNFKIDQNKWRAIKAECETKNCEITEMLKSLEKQLLMSDEFERKVWEVEYFERANIDTVLKSIPSLILGASLRRQFFNLCKFQVGKHKFDLLYRGTRDGFSTADFHAKCDNRSNTITIIKTTKGFIFGGYTETSWSSPSQGVYKSDPKAFTFSLVNKLDKPFVCQVFKPEYAIHCCSLNGPTFGVTPLDIYICDNSNTVMSSYCRPNNFKMPADVNDPKGFFYCDEKNFLVKEVEVFQVSCQM